MNTWCLFDLIATYMTSYKDILSLEPFRKLHIFLEKEANNRYHEIVSNFLCDVWAILSMDERYRLNRQISPELLDSFYVRINLEINRRPNLDTFEPVAEERSPLKECPLIQLKPHIPIENQSDKEPLTPSVESSNWAKGLIPLIIQKGESRIAEDDRCMARTSLGKQCTRKRRAAVLKGGGKGGGKGGSINKKVSGNVGDEHLLCSSHMVANPYGLINGENPHENKKKRREFLNKLHKGTKGIDLSQYIRTTEIEFEGEHYLLDENGIFYRPHDLVIVGRTDNNKIYWYQ